MTKPGRIESVRCLADDVDEAIAADRRQFVRGVGLAMLTVQMLPVIAHAATHSAGNGNDATHDLIIHSGPGAFGHVHDLLVPYAILRTPPREGVELTSTKVFLHTHRIALTQNDLMTVNQGRTVTKKSSSHLFVIALANREDRSRVGAGNRG
jgi:hypothetical protein